MSVLLLLAIVAVEAFSQELISKGKFGITVGDRIEKVEFPEQGRKLRLIGQNGVTLWDVESGQLLSAVNYGKNDRIDFAALAPDGRRVLSADVLPGRKLEDLKPAAVYELDTGRRIFTFDRRIEGGFWSANNRTLVSADRVKLNPREFFPGTKTELSLWDGETFALRKTLAFDRLYEAFLSDDGAKLYAYSTRDRIDRIEVYNALTGALENTLLTSTKAFQFKNGLAFSPSGKLFGLVVANGGDKNGRTLMIWATGGDPKPVYEIKPPNISSTEILFSRDEKLVALDTGKNIGIFELATQKRVGEVANSSLPRYWLAGNSVFLYGSALGVGVSTGLAVYRLETVYETVEDTDPVNGNKETRIIDETFVVPAPNDQNLLTFSNNLLKVYDSSSGRLLQTLLEPPGKKPDGIFEKINDQIGKIVKTRDTTRLISESGWSEDGKCVYAIDQDRGTVKLWAVR